METLCLRPHHLLCTRAFKGNGYSPAFVENMQRVIDRLKTGCDITLVTGVDAICALCPERIGNHCRSEAKVMGFDEAVLSQLGLERKTYTYTEIEKVLTARLTEPVYECICRGCEWKQTGICCYADVKRSLLAK
ncbi:MULTISPECIES: DUF1284 domain-containing protein [unclassified Treponema]|uniref:DUF1284 domain-containing protein n=1 Tax=unclassified Treponema TaxID=2638727 RepID=UPI0005300CFF|nr:MULTISPECIES: DUF1284 domain-containing protein [unclassified Treponema]AIW90142.1 (Fe-S)-binding protein [Treponema sp. OMZ 838]UTC49873.1 DUF1284 domain-containing protein [Treponema sp. OMZ 855]